MLLLPWLWFPFVTDTGPIKVKTQRPNIVFILADDLGWNDVGWNNPEIYTPNLDRLAREGVILDQSYVLPLCTPSRSALLTGVYPFKMGMQHGVVRGAEPYGMPLKYKILPEHLKQLGYSTHVVGKWHLGFCDWSYTPTYRGFDSFLGLYTGGSDYYSHMSSGRLMSKSDNSESAWPFLKHIFKPREKAFGFDFRDGTNVTHEYDGLYSTTVFADRAIKVIADHAKDRDSEPLFLYLPFQAPHIPLQAPERYHRQYWHIQDEARRTFSAMVTAMDEGVGNITRALKQYGLQDNTIVIFTSDNGASPRSGGSNWPLRGAKGTVWEGGTRVPTFINSKLLKKTGYVNSQPFHMVDWLPTLLAAAGRKDVHHIDGMNQWSTLSKGFRSRRKEFVYNIDKIGKQAAIR